MSGARQTTRISIPIPPLPVSPFTIPTSTVTTPEIFRSHFPAFVDPATYPDANVQFFIDLGTVTLVAPRWGQMYQYGVELFTAHMLALQQYAMRGASGVPGAAIGVVQSKSVSKVSVSYDTTLSAVEGGGPWNLTVFGQQLLWWANLLGTGGIEMLSVGFQGSMEGQVNTWARGVMIGYYNQGAGL